jgi:hypothetical protein
MKDAFSAGAHFFLSKPLDLAKLRHLASSTHGTLLREQRRSRQVPLAVEITCRAGPRSFSGVTSQISEQGLVFRLVLCREGSLHPGELVHVRFCLPASSHALETMSVIMRTDEERHTSCRFQKLAEETRKAVQEFVASSPEQGPPISGAKSEPAAFGRA